MRKEYQSISLPNGERAIVFDWMDGPRPDRNLVCTKPDGGVKWVAELPTTDPIDCFVGVRQDQDSLLANTMSGYAIWIDSVTGKTLRNQFTK
jgi:hypothetical protein